MRVNRERALAIGLALALVFWGGYVSIAWVGVPAHRAALLDSNDRSPGCAESEWFCGGLSAAVPAFGYAIGRWLKAPDGGSFTSFFWFIAVGGVVAAATYLRLRSGARTSRPSLSLSPLRLGAVWLVMLWLLFSAMSFGMNGGTPYRRIFEPTARAYPGAGAEALAALSENVQRLETRGCLIPTGRDGRGLATYDLSVWCMQASFVTRVVAPLAVVLLLACLALAVGESVLALIAWRPDDAAAETLVSLTLGAGTLIAGLWLLADVRLFTRSGVSALLAMSAAVSARGGWRQIQRLSSFRWSWEWRWGRWLCAWAILSFTALNCLSVIRPFPIGWDDLGLYLNKPRLLASYGSLIPQMGSFQWEFVTAVPFALFGYGSTLAATTALAINWSASLLAAFGVYSTARMFVGRGSLLAVLVFITLPVIAQISFGDLKIDNAVFAVAAAAVVCVWLALGTAEAAGTNPRRAGSFRALAMAGALAGLAFSMKPTAIMLGFALGALVAGLAAGGLAFVGAGALGFALLASIQFDASEVSSRLGLTAGAVSPRALAAALAVTGITLIAAAVFRHREASKRLGAALTVFAAGVVIAVAPWLIANNVRAPEGQRGLLLEAPGRETVVFDLAGTMTPAADRDIRSLPPDLRMHIDGCRATGKSEELDRYWGAGRGFSHYASLPWRVVMNADVSGYHVTTAGALLVSPMVLLLPWFWTPAARGFRWLSALTVFLLLQWIVFGNGIPWYGIALFLGLSLSLAALVAQAPTRALRMIAGALVGVSVLFNLSLREGQYQATRNHYEYMLGKVSPDVVAERVVPHYDDIRDAVIERAAAHPSRPFAYRIGTFIAYFVPKNLQLLPIADNQLDFFACLNQERNPALTLGRLRALGFNSIIFDTTVETIETDPNGSLHQKVRAFLEFVNTPNLGLQVLINDTQGGVAFLLLP